MYNNIIILNDTMYVVYGPVNEMPTCSMFVNLHYTIHNISYDSNLHTHNI